LFHRLADLLSGSSAAEKIVEFSNLKAKMAQPPQSYRPFTPPAASAPQPARPQTVPPKEPIGKETETVAQGSDTVPVIFCDIVQTVGIHNGVARIRFIRLGSDGKPIPALELLLPADQAASLVTALQDISG
jgi:hypothetical protein